MRKFKNVTTPFEGDFYTILEIDGVKHINILGYTYAYPYDGEWADEITSRIAVPLAEFIDEYRKRGNEYVDELYEECPSYYVGYSIEAMVDRINKYFDGKPADAYLPFGQLDTLTPCGNYIRRDIRTQRAEECLSDAIKNADIGDRIYELARYIFQSSIRQIEEEFDISDKPDEESGDMWYDDSEDTMMELAYQRIDAFFHPLN